jgi:hypothetical protein
MLDTPFFVGDALWCRIRALYKENWTAIAEKEEKYYPAKSILLCWGFMRPHKYTEFSRDERRKIVCTRECMWGLAERAWYRRIGCLYDRGNPTISNSRRHDVDLLVGDGRLKQELRKSLSLVSEVYSCSALIYFTQYQ